MPNQNLPELGDRMVSVVAVCAILLALVINIKGCQGKMRTENKEVEVVKL